MICNVLVLYFLTLKNESVLKLLAYLLVFQRSEVSIILEQLINDVENEVPDSNFSATDLLAKSMAKTLAIKTGQSLKKRRTRSLSK